MARCIICNNSVYSGEAKLCADNSYICNSCLSKVYRTKADFLFRYQSEIDQLLKHNGDEVKKIISEMSEENERKQKDEEEKQRIRNEEILIRQEEIRKTAKKVIVTTGDLHRDYEIIGPVYIQVNNKSNQFSTLRKKHVERLEELQKSGQGSNDSTSFLEIMELLFLNGGAYNGHSVFDDAFFVAVEELKEKAAWLGADAVVGMRQDIDLDSTGFQYFYLQMYGTAVKYL